MYKCSKADIIISTIQYPKEQKFYSRMRAQKQNEYSSFSKLLTKINTSNLGEYELKILKQEHDYLDRLRHQRIRIEELKKKYDDAEGLLTEQREMNLELNGMLEEKCRIIESLQHELTIEIGKRENLEKTVQRQTETDKNKPKSRVKELEHENEELKRMLRQKEVLVISMEEQFAERVKKLNSNFQAERKSLIGQLEQKLNEAKSKNSDAQVLQLRTLVSRQNKALKQQNEKYLQLTQKNQYLCSQLEILKQSNEHSTLQAQEYQQKIQQLYDELQEMQGKLEKQDQNNRLKGQLEEIRRKMTDMQKGEIQRIQFIVNQME